MIAAGTGDFIEVGQNSMDGSHAGIFGRQMAVPVFSGEFDLGDVCAWSAVESGGFCSP